MKTLLFIVSLPSALLLMPKNQASQKKQIPATVSAAYIDSVLEVGRVERMEAKYMQNAVKNR